MRFTITLAAVVGFSCALASSARAGGDIGVIVTGEGSMQPQLAAQIADWLSRHGHTVNASPLPPDAVSLLLDCFMMDNTTCARTVVEERAKSTSVIYARVDAKASANNGARSVTLTAYWFDKGHDAIAERKTCERCTDQSLRTTADEIMRKLVGGDGHVKLKSAPPGARIVIDGQPIGVTPLDWDLPPGKHTIVMDKAGFEPASRDVVTVSDKTELLVVELTTRRSDGQDAAWMRYVPVGMAITGGLLIAGGGVMIAIDQDLGPKEPPQIRNTAPAGVGMAIGGAVLGGVGAYLLWFRSPNQASTPVAVVTGDTAYVGWTGRF